LFDAPDNVIAEFPQFESIRGYDNLKAAIRRVSVRDIPA
jgi:phosphoserine/homoserine phosphotransferase